MPRTGNTRDGAREPAREVEFRRFVLATAVSVLGTYAAAIALAVRTYQDTGNPAWVSAVFAAEFLPPVAIGVLVADRLNRLQPRRGAPAPAPAGARRLGPRERGGVRGRRRRPPADRGRRARDGRRHGSRDLPADLV